MNEEQRKVWLLIQHEKDAEEFTKKYGVGFCYLDIRTRKPVFEKDLKVNLSRREGVDALMSKALHKITWKPKVNK